MKRLALSAVLLCCAGAPLALPATALVCGQPQTGSVSANGTSTAYSFGGQAGDSILIRIIPVTSSVSFSSPVLQDPTGLVVKSLAGYKPHDSLFYTYNLQTAGAYLYTISGTSVGNYMIVYVPLNRLCSASGTLSCGTASKGSLAPGQMQTYQLNGKLGDQMSLRLLSTSGDPGAAVEVIGFDSASQLQVIGPGQSLFFDVNAIAQQSYKLTSDGPQTFVIVEASGRLNLNYSINVLDLSGPCAASAVSCGSAVDGSIGDALSVAAYSLNANKGDIYLLRSVNTNLSSSLAPVLQFLDAQANPVPQQTTSDPLAGQYTLAAGGQYTILFSDAKGTGTGKFSFSLARLNSPCNTQTISCGSITNGQVNGPVRFTTYALSAQAGDLYLVRLLKTGDSTNFKPRIQVYGPDGSPMQFVTTSTLGSVTFATPSAGTYALLASDSFDGTETGTYTFSTGRLNAPCSGATALTCGTMAPGSITQPLQTGIYSYTGDTFTVRLIDTGGSLQTALQVYAPNTTGQPLPLRAGNGKGVDVAGASGTYTILVTDQSSTPQTGTWALEAFGTKGNCAASPPAGQSVSGLTSGPAPFTAYTFAASQGEPLLLRLASFTPGFTANMDLYDPNGKLVGSSTFRLPGAGQLPASASGNYTAVVGASAPRTAGSYAFSWQALDQPAATPLACGQTVSGALGASSQFSYYALNANDGDLLKLLLTRVPGTVNAQVELFDSKGVAVKSSTTEIDQKVSAGSYTVLVSPASAAAESGGFALALQKPNNPCSPLNLTCGQTILQPVTVPGQLDSYVFSGNAGDQAAITVTPRLGAISPVTELYDPSGNFVAGGSTSVNTTLTATGPYTLTVHDRTGGNTGSYRVGLQHTNTPCPEDDTQKPTITLLRPTGGEVMAGGAPYQIAWQSDDNVAVASHTIQLSTDGGKTFVALPGGPTTTLNGLAQSFSWTVPAGITPTRTAVVRVTATDKGGNTQAAASDLLTLIGSGFTANENVTYSYDRLNRVVQASYGDGRIIFYNYDAGGNLVNIIVQ